MIESAKDQVLGVDDTGQQVPPRVWYGMPCLDEWKIGVVTRLGSHGARGAVGPLLPRETLAMIWYCILH
jgi:hypothetical protein